MRGNILRFKRKSGQRRGSGKRNKLRAGEI
jgi:hypothetical protein